MTDLAPSSQRQWASTSLLLMLLFYRSIHVSAWSSPPTIVERRQFMGAAGAALLVGPATTADAAQQQVQVQRAVGSAELSCRQEGNCLEKGEWDGAVGWQWGGKDRCDATDPRCGPDGKLQDAVPTGAPVPSLSNKLTHQLELELSIGRSGEVGTLRIGLYGEDCPASVEQLVSFFSPEGLTTTSPLLFEEGYGAISESVKISTGGALNAIVPFERLDFGVPSQANAFARKRGMSKAGENFTPQPRPSKTATQQDAFVRNHNSAGLLSVPKNGLGYGGSGFESEDEAFESAFEITASASPSMDREGRRVVGQLLDAESMSFLARLASLPTKKGLKGVIPGQNAGPPLLKVSVQGVNVKFASSS